MANNYASGTFEPQISHYLFTESDLALMDALGVSVEKGSDGLANLFNENYCTSGYIETEDGEKEVTEDDLYTMLQELIKRSNGELKFITHEQAYTCDKMCPGQFGGSAVIITADDIQYSGTSSWLERRIAEVETGDTGPDTEEPDDEKPSANRFAEILCHILETFPQADAESEFFNDPIDGCEAVNFISEIVPEIRRALSEPEGNRVIDVLREAWCFIENVTDDDPKRNDKFFELRGKVRDIFWANDHNIDGVRSEVATANPLIEMIARLTKDGEEVDGNEFIMENDDAVNTLNDLIDEARALVNQTKPTPPTAPNYESELRGVLRCCLDQMCQMQGMFNDEDGTIRQAITDAEVALALPQTYRKPTTLAICVEGGCVHSVETDNPDLFKGVQAVVVDGDTNQACAGDDIRLGLVIDQAGDISNAYMQAIGINPSTIDLGRVADFINGKAYGSAQENFAIFGEYPCEGCKDVNSDGERCVNEATCLAYNVFSNYNNKPVKSEPCDGCPEPDGEPKCNNTRCCFWPGNDSTWNYHQHGEHPVFRKEDWQQEVANKDTVLDYQSWVEHQLESLLHDANH
jgi:hypothetical protein